MDEHGKVHKVKCKVCTKIKGKEKLMALKLDNLWKQGGSWKKIMAIPKVYNVSEYYMNKDFIHAKNECLYATTRKDTIINQIYQATILNLGRKIGAIL
jgi:hypothetical protein